jgi:hypothetical protein
MRVCIENCARSVLAAATYHDNLVEYSKRGRENEKLLLPPSFQSHSEPTLAFYLRKGFDVCF